MKANVLKTQFVVAKQKLRLPVRAEREGRVAAANGMLPKMYKGFPYLRKIACEIGHSFSLRLVAVEAQVRKRITWIFISSCAA
jgi:hypothetical protein